MARRADHTREELKKLILTTAWSQIGRDGFEALTARGIAGAIGYTPGTIYNIFESMDDLHLQLNARTLDMLYDILNNPKCRDPQKSPVENIKFMAIMYLEFAQQFHPYWLMMFSYRLPEGRQSIAWYQEKIDRLFLPLENLLQSFFKPAQDKKRKMAARTLWASLHGLCFLQQTGRIPLLSGKMEAGEMAFYLIDIFVAGMKADV